MSEGQHVRSFFSFRMVDRNSNEINLAEFRDKDLIVVINCTTVQQVDEIAPLYYKIEDKFEKKIQILCLPGNRFFYDGHGEESERLIVFLKNKSNCHVEDEDGLTFFIHNKEHIPKDETVTFVGSNLSFKDMTDAITKALN